MKRSLFFLAFLPFVITCRQSEQEAKLIPLYENLSKYQRKVSTQSSEAQKYFDQGLTLYYGFNHEAAILSFRQAIIADSNCAMAWWGQAISAGPNINNPVMDSAAKVAAWETLLKAVEFTHTASTVEKKLISALAKRYAWPAPEDRGPLDTAYAEAMREVYEAFPDDMDVCVLFADAMMNLRPWDHWSPSGKSNPGTHEIVSVLEYVLNKEPDHPAACHFYIHTMEASPFPEKALAAANTLRNRIPGAGHLVHMPSHIDIRLGHYKDAIEANQKAIIADSIWVSRAGFYSFYRAHNHHFLIYAAMFDGQKNLALEASRQIEKQIPLEQVRSFPDYLDGFYAVTNHVMVRFGMWDELLAQPQPPSGLYLTKAFWHYSRTVAFAAKGQVDDAAKEYDSLIMAYNQVPDSRMIGNNPGKVVLDIGLLMAKGELEYRKENYNEAFDLLRLAVQKDDSLRYDEPWGWMMPVRHALGALLVEQGLYEEAEIIYKKDLSMHPDNGWALKGLANCYLNTDQHDEAMSTEALFAKAWSRSDIVVKSSCFCSRKGS